MTDQNDPNYRPNDPNYRPNDPHYRRADGRPADDPTVAYDRPADDRTVAYERPVVADAGDRRVVDPADRPAVRDTIVDQERAEYGGVKVGSAFFGWIAAMGIAVLLTALVAATGAAIGLGTAGSTDKAINAANNNAETVSLWGAIALVVIMFVSYYCGGYVAGRMARFSGLLNGLFVWLWAVLIAIIVAVVTAIAGSQYNILGNVNAFPRIPISEGTLSTGGLITAIVIAAVSLIGALLGGLAGMHFHRKVDRAGVE